MKCMICDSPSSYFFSKTYTKAPFDKLMSKIGDVNYYKCNNCGFVSSQTHAQLDKKEWSDLNSNFHHYIETPGHQSTINQPPYAEQAMALAMLGRNDIIDLGSMLDYAAGYGSLSKILNKYYHIDLPIFDFYVRDTEYNKYIEESDMSKYQTVLNSAMFEHVLYREDLDRVNDLVSPSGALVIHTVICERIPKDPDWFYLDAPVHTAFHTNKSMNILMEQWGYRSSIYSPQSKSWVLLRNKIEDVSGVIDTINNELQKQWFFYKNGFVDYWKGF